MFNKWFNIDSDNYDSYENHIPLSETDIKRNEMIDTLYFIYTNSCDIPQNPEFPLTENALCSYILIYKNDLDLAKKVYMEWKNAIKTKKGN